MTNSRAGLETGAARDPGKELRLLFAYFGDSHPPDVRFHSPDGVPAPYHDLIVHQGHMTESLEHYHGSPVAVHPYAIHHHGDMYGRKLDLTSRASGLVVMTGLMIINLSFVRDEVREAIIEGKTPLGRILISHNVLREVSTGAFLELAKGDPLVERFHLDKPASAYGRLATIFCDGLPAVELLEIVRP